MKEILEIIALMKPTQLNDSSVNDAIDTPACQFKGKDAVIDTLKYASRNVQREIESLKQAHEQREEHTKNNRQKRQP